LSWKWNFVIHSCEVYRRESISDGVIARLELFQATDQKILFDIVERQDARIVELESRLNALEAKRGGR
jgi:hypothetical protein